MARNNNMAPVVGVVSAIAVGAAVAYALSNPRTKEKVGKQIDKLREDGMRVYSEVRRKAAAMQSGRTKSKGRKTSSAVALELPKRGRGRPSKQSAKRK